ncbi:MAG: sodium-dependent transporter, partial [Kiritimatiellae bacterium]|nr:sodium-dependent transporter [Kiritimatiellia bacterium]
LTSAISMTEALVAAVCDFFKTSRGKSVAVIGVWSVAIGALSAFGYGRWSSLKFFGLPPLDFFDTSMNILTPIVAALICVFVGWVLSPKRILAECQRSGERVGFRLFYVIMVRFVAPILIGAILVSEICRCLKIGGWSI